MNKSIVIFCGLVLSNTVCAEPYIGLKVGKSEFKDGCSSMQTCEDNSYSIGIFGGVSVLDFLHLEASFEHLGRYTLQGIEDDFVQAYTLAPKLQLPISSKLTTFVKVGGAYVNIGGVSDGTYLGSIGAEYYINNSSAVRFEYQHLSDVTNKFFTSDVDTFWLNLSYNFSQSQKDNDTVQLNGHLKPVDLTPKNLDEEQEPQTTRKNIYDKIVLDHASFDIDSYVLSAANYSTIDKLVQLLRANPTSVVEITGYTDSSGSSHYNQKLSEKRAESVAKALMSRGINESRISVEGKGEKNPIASNNSSEGREQNRRVEMVIPAFDHLN